jgi:hypothetical protein
MTPVVHHDTEHSLTLYIANTIQVRAIAHNGLKGLHVTLVSGLLFDFRRQISIAKTGNGGFKVAASESQLEGNSK